jgi:hypothetical protein
MLDPINNPDEIMGGVNNPNPALVGELISKSDSVVIVPLYSGTPLSPGESGPNLFVTITGFLKVFIEETRNPQATIDAHVLDIIGCGAGGSSGGGSGGSGGTVITTSTSDLPVRLVRPGN